MKNPLKSFWIVIIMAGTICCAKFMEEDPATTLSGSAVFSTKSGTEAAMIGCYSQLHSVGLWTSQMFEFLGNSSGLIHWKNQRTDNDWTQSLDLTYYSTTGMNSGAYRDIYRAVYSCNTVIEGVGESSVDDRVFKEEIIAEARFLRALLYFTAVRMWGDVPLYTETPKTNAEMNRPRTSYLDIYRQILDDLKAAEVDMRDYDRVVQLTGHTGRMCKWAATALKAKVYVQIGSILGYQDYHPFKADPDFTACGITSAADAWLLALETCEHIIAQGPYELEDRFQNLFQWTIAADFQLKERIIMIQTTENGTAGNSFTASRTLPNYPYGTNHLSTNNTNNGRVRPSRFLFQKWAATYGGQLASGRGDGLTDIYINCVDPRFDATYMHTSMQQYANNGASVNTVDIYPANGRAMNLTEDNAQPNTCMPYFKKYLDPNYNGGYGYADMYVMRYADIFLMAAEAAAELSQSVGDAYWEKTFAHIETIHARARRSSAIEATHPKWTAGRFVTKEELIDALMFERFYELHGEGHEWFDIRRKGAEFLIRNLIKPLNVFNQLPSQQPNLNNSNQIGFWKVAYLSYIYPETAAEIRRRLLCAFPLDEIRVNNALTFQDQNMYYVQ